jgi:hypothetical protein
MAGTIRPEMINEIVVNENRETHETLTAGCALTKPSVPSNGAIFVCGFRDFR